MEVKRLNFEVFSTSRLHMWVKTSSGGGGSNLPVQPQICQIPPPSSLRSSVTQLLIRRRCLEATEYSWGFFPWGLSHHHVSVYAELVCLFVHAYACACVCHKGKRALRPAVPVLRRGCLLTVPFTSQHGPGRWIWQKWPLCHINLSRHTNTCLRVHTHTHTCSKSRQTKLHTHLVTPRHIWRYRTNSNQTCRRTHQKTPIKMESNRLKCSHMVYNHKLRTTLPRYPPLWGT